MKSFSKIVLLTLALYSIGCSEGKKTEHTSSETKEELSTITPSVTSETTKSDSSPTVQSAIVPTPKIQASPVAKEVTKNAIVLNPPHGQPGHDCAVPEGAPLNSKPQATLPASKPQNTTPSAILPQSNPILNPTTNLTGEKLNPAHGLPGHDCAIPVGAPLK
jgi:hypothetical protein